MSQHDYNIANGGGAAVRADINNALAAILSQNSGATAPTTTKPFMLWYDTANALIKMRNAADTGWIDYMNTSGQLVAPTATGLITALGGQIKFPTTQIASSDANTMDDYEEGTFTATLSFGGGSTGIIYANNTFAYQKVGNTVHITGYINITNKGSSTGDAVISGLPFTSLNISAAYSSSGMHLNGVSFGGYPNCFIPTNTTTISLYQCSDAGNATALSNSNFSNTSGLIFNFTYRAAT
jgi:hypothetical protein